ncbi:nicotinamidase-related amidase [Bradyrhizobium sp. LB7.2]
MKISDRDVLLVIDVQNDFCTGGALAVPSGEKVVPAINRIAQKFANVVLTQDWHPRDHVSFASNHAGKQPFQTIALDYGAQVLWPSHCVQGTAGAEFHRDLDVTRASLVVRKGFRRGIDSYSALFENDKKNTDRPARIFARTRVEHRLRRRPRARLLRPLFGGGCPRGGVRCRRHRGCLLWHRSRRLDGRDPSEFSGARHSGHRPRGIPVRTVT